MTKREDAESERHKREDAVEEKLARGNCRGVSSHLIIIINSRVALVVVVVVVVVAVEGPRDHPLESPTPIPSVLSASVDEERRLHQKLRRKRRQA